MNRSIRSKEMLPAKATGVDLTALVLFVNTLFNVLGFFAGLATTAFNFAINLGLFFLGALL